jgi:ribosome maturation factor RimP
MAKESISEIVAPLAMDIAEEAGCELVDVEFVKEGGSWFLRVYIDKDGGVSLEDCEKVSKPLSKKLDELDPISHEYSLEVSSPGDRPLKKPRDFEKAIGTPIEVRLFKAVDNLKKFEGELISYDGESLTIRNEENQQHKFQMEQISKVKKIFKF